MHTASTLIFIYILVWVFVCTCVCACMCVYMCAYVCVHVYVVYTCVHVCACVCERVCVHVCVCTCCSTWQEVRGQLYGVTFTGFQGLSSGPQASAVSAFSCCAVLLTPDSTFDTIIFSVLSFTTRACCALLKKDFLSPRLQRYLILLPSA